MGFEISPYRKKKGNGLVKSMAGGILVTSLVVQGISLNNANKESIEQLPAIYPSEMPIKFNLNQSLPSRGESNRSESIKPNDNFNGQKVIAAIRNNLGGKLKQHAEFIYNTSKKQSVNPMLVAAIAKHETGNGTSSAIISLNNPGGLMGNNGLMKFNTLQDGLNKMIIVLKEYYIDQGLTTIEQIQKKYCPVGASNDPTNLNVHWLPAVTKTYLKILEEAR